MIIRKYKNNLFILFLFILFAINACQPTNVGEYQNTDVDTLGKIVIAKTVNNRDYYYNVYSLFDNAEKSIYIIMYNMKYYDYDPGTEEMKLLEKLATKALEGLDVRIILEQSDWNDDINNDNYTSGKYLSDNNAKVRYDPLTVTTHCKTMIIDSIYVLIGSTNWSKSAINYNNETNVLLEGREIANEFIDYFSTLWNSSYERE